MVSRTVTDSMLTDVPLASDAAAVMRNALTTDVAPLKTLQKLQHLPVRLPGTTPLQHEWDSVRTLFRNTLIRTVRT